MREKINDSAVDREGLSAYKKEAEHEFELLGDGTKQIWDMKRR